MIWRGVQVKPYRNSAEKDTVQVGFQYYYHIQADQELTDDLEEACKLNSTKNKQTKNKNKTVQNFKRGWWYIDDSLLTV